jgi:peptide/nickel transport system ATP-binding protein
MMSLLAVDGLSVQYATPRGAVRALDDVSFAIPAGGALGLVGESGSGKSTVALALLDLLAAEATLTARAMQFDGTDLLARRRALRGDRISLVFQDPSQALNPAILVGRQIAEPLVRHRGLTPTAAFARAVELLAEVGIPRPADVAAAYPHQLSGGMKQRALIATALGCQPRLLVLDEPTTALDVTIEAQILDLLDDLRARRGLSLLFVSHNLGVIERLCDEVCVLYAGRVVERGATATLFADPRHPYTRGLLGSLPRPTQGRLSRLTPIPGGFPDLIAPPPGCIFAERCGLAEPRCAAPQPLIEPAPGHVARCWKAPTLDPVSTSDTPRNIAAVHRGGEQLLNAEDLTKRFHIGGWFARRRPAVSAVDQVSIRVDAGEVVGLVGESGCGKSTLGRLLLRLVDPDAGSIHLAGADLAQASGKRLKALRKLAQMVFQNPDGSLNPRKTVRQILRRPIKLQGLARGAAADTRVDEILARVRLPVAYASRYPHQLSGGEKQRVSIARALATEPRFIVLDEATSALDVSVQAAVLNLLADLRDELGVAYLLISHDLSVVAHLADRICVMYRGALVEQGRADQVLAPPYHPYTEALLSAVPVVGDARRSAGRVRLKGGVVTDRPIAGCRFHDRCPRFLGEICTTIDPPPVAAADGHTIRCHIPPHELAALPSVFAAAGS